MSEHLRPPNISRFPDLDREPGWVRELSTGVMLARIYRATGPHPAEWFDFRAYGPLDGRFDPHPLPTGEYPQHGVMYTAVESTAARPSAAPGDAGASAIAACLVEVFQQHRIIDRMSGTPTLVMFEIERPLRLLDLADSDWLTVAGGNNALVSGPRDRSREWARAIWQQYPGLDGVFAPSSLIPSARTATLWRRAHDAFPEFPEALIPLERRELTPFIDEVATRYGYTLI